MYSGHSKTAFVRHRLSVSTHVIPGSIGVVQPTMAQSWKPAPLRTTWKLVGGVVLACTSHLGYVEQTIASFHAPEFWSTVHLELPNGSRTWDKRVLLILPSPPPLKRPKKQKCQHRVPFGFPNRPPKSACLVAPQPLPSSARDVPVGE